jgi:hypothetical protein
LVSTNSDNNTKNINDSNENVIQETTKKTDIFLTMNTDIENQVLKMSGSTNLPDGAILVYEIKHNDVNDPNFLTKQAKKLSEGMHDELLAESDKRFTEGHIEVRDGLWDVNVDVSNWIRGTVEVWVAFQTIIGTKTKQPDEIIEVYGQWGENLTGSQVTQSGENLKRVEVIEEIRLD